MGKLLSALTGDKLVFSFPAMGVEDYKDIKLPDPDKHLEALIEAVPTKSPVPPEGRISIELQSIPWLLKGFKPGELGSNELNEKRTKEAKSAKALGRTEHCRLVARMNLALLMRREEDLRLRGEAPTLRYFTEKEAKAVLEAPEEEQLSRWSKGAERPDLDHLTLIVIDEDKKGKVVTKTYVPINLVITDEFIEQINHIKKERAMAAKTPKPIEEMLTKESNGPAPYFCYGKEETTKYPVKEFQKLKKNIEAQRKAKDSPVHNLEEFLRWHCFEEEIFKAAVEAKFSRTQAYEHMAKLDGAKGKKGDEAVDDNRYMAEIIARTIPCLYHEAISIEALTLDNLEHQSIKFDKIDRLISLDPIAQLALMEGLDYDGQKVIAILEALKRTNGTGSRGVGKEHYICLNKKASSKKPDPSGQVK